MAAAVDYDAHLQRVIALHFDPVRGAPFWLERQAVLGLDALREIRTLADLARLGAMSAAALRERPLLDFVPVSQRGRLVGGVIAETGGATGRPKRTVFSRDEFTAAFVTPFVQAADHAGFPRGGPWLWLGPSGPHVIGHAALACATALESPPPLAVDFDPRWYRRLPAESFARQRYLEHVVEQALDVLRSEPVEVLFATPAVLAKLVERMSAGQREKIRGVHYGGMRVSPAALRTAQLEWFPNAVHLAGYGNSLFGVCMEFGGPADRRLCYHPHGPRHVVQVAADGRVWMSRLDETALIANLPERDVAEVGGAAPVAGFGMGVVDPRPRAEEAAAADGIY